MKRLILIIISTVFCAVSAAYADFINFELWNKHVQPLYYTVGNSMSQTMTKKPLLLRAGKWDSATIDTSRPTFILISMNHEPKKGQKVDVFEIKPGGTIYARVGLLPETKFTEFLKWLGRKKSIYTQHYIFGPQTGPLLGTRNITERGHDLKHNFKFDDIKYHTVFYQ